MGKEVIAIIASWALFIMYLIFGAMELVTPDGRSEDGLFKTGCCLLLALDGIATFHYLSILPWYYQLLLTIMVPLCIGFFGKYGLTLVLGGISDFVEASKGE